jgi:hypothetical protein
VNPGEIERCGDGVDNDCEGGDAACRYIGTFGLGSVGIEIIGEGPGDYAGWSVASAGDVNADGYDDLLVGAWGAWAVYLINGPLSGDRDFGTTEARVVGDAWYGEHPGWSVSSAGTLDADGNDDLLIGAPHDDDGVESAGAAYIVLASGTVDGDLAWWDPKYIGENAGDNAGTWVAPAGDVYNDGYDDFLIGAPYNDAGGTDAGAAYMFYGPPAGGLDLAGADGIFTGAAAGDLAGSAVSSAGDVDGDDTADLLVGAYLNDDGRADAGAAFLLLAADRAP